MELLISLEQLIEYLEENVPRYGQYDISPPEDESKGGFRLSGGHQYVAPDPFSDPGNWVGDDRIFFVLLPDGYGTNMRCVNRQTNRVYSLKEFVDTLENSPAVDWVQVEKSRSSFSGGSTSFNKKKSTATGTVSPELIFQWHSQVDRDYWHGYNIPDFVIDKLKLGLGSYNAVAGSDRTRISVDRHIIPVPLYGDKDYVFLSRRAKSNDPITRKHDVGRGYKTTYYVADTSFDPTQVHTLAFAEGGISTLSVVSTSLASVCVTPMTGAGSWHDEWTQELFRRYPNVERILVFPDNDEPGERYRRRVIQSVKRVSSSLKMSVMIYYLEYGGAVPEHWDAADFLQKFGSMAGTILNSYFVPAQTLRTPKKYSSDGAQHFEFEDIKLSSIEELRNFDNTGSIYQRIQGFVDSKDTDGVFLVSADPGTGKSYSYVHALQDMAREYQDSQEEKYRKNILKANELRLSDPEDDATLKYIDRLEKKPPVNFAIVALPFRKSLEDLRSHEGFDEDMWYDFQPRSELNCKLIDIVDMMQDKNYVVQKSVCNHCPARDWCEQQGYLSQYGFLRDKPIVVVRHNNLLYPKIFKATGAKVLLVDESPVETLMTPLVFGKDDISLPEGWRSTVSRASEYQIDVLFNTLLAALDRGAYEKKVPTVLNGRQLVFFLDHIALSITNNLYTFNDLVHDMLEGDHPSYSDLKEILNDHRRLSPNSQGVPDWDEAPVRSLDIIFEALAEGILNEQDDWNSRVSLYGKSFYLYEKVKIPVPDKTKVVVADATPRRSLLRAMFNGNNIIEYRAITNNPNAETTLVVGNDMPKTKVGSHIRSNGDTDFVDGHPNASIRVVHRVVSNLALRHDKLLVITYKKICKYLEKVVDQKNVSFVHWYSLRGLNDYKDYDSLLIVGLPRRPGHIYEMTGYAWAADLPKLDFSTRLPVEVPVGPGHSGSITWYGFQDEWVNSYVREDIESEFLQGAGRIRAHSSNTPKYIYHIGQFSALPFVTRVEHYSNFYDSMGGNSLQQIITQLMTEYFINSRVMDNKKPRLPGIRRVANMLRERGEKVSEPRLKLVMEEVKPFVLEDLQSLGVIE